jgi:tetratricopeptide (TPR) repeat protein
VTPERQPNLDTERMINAYGLARTQYFRALLYPPDSVERKYILDEALKILLDFQLDYADQMLCFEGYIYEGLCHKALNDPEGALSSFDEAIRLREYYPEERGIYKVEPAAADTISSAVLQKMLLLSEQGDHAGAVALAEEYIASIPEPYEALKGKAVLAQEAEAFAALGDNERLTATAKRMLEIDPNGPLGRRGRELLGGGSSGSLGAGEVLRLAESSYTSDPDKAIELFQQAMALTRGTADRANVGARAGYLIGALYSGRSQLHEAAVAWDTTADRFPEGKDAPECLWQAISTYLKLQSYERRPVYKDLAQARLAELTRRYPEHPRAAMAALIDGQQAEAEGDYKRAADVYERVPESSAAYEEALYRAGNAWATMARTAFAEKQADVAKQAVSRAEKLFQKAREALEKASTETLEISSQERFRSLAFNARVGLANLYLEPDVARAGDVMGLFQRAESELGDDAGRMATVWELRFRALSEQKKLDEAMQLFDARMKENPNAPWLASGARLLAPILDARGSELRKADPKSAEADRLWRKAAANYLLAIKGQLEGREAVQLESLEGVADRLFIFALHFEGLPDTVESFVDYSGPPLGGELLDATVRAYELILPLTPSYRTAIKLARTLGFLGRWEETAARYAELFERESFANLTTKTINQEAAASKPELLFALIEWGVSERTLGVERGDVQRLVRASSIFESMVMGTTVGSKLWWQAKFYQMQTLVDRGDYEVADVAMKSLRLTWEQLDENKYGLQERFKKLEEEIKKKVF